MGHRFLKQKNKGKARAPADSDIGEERPRHGKKRAAEDVTIADDADADENEEDDDYENDEDTFMENKDDTTPRKSEKSRGRQPPHVVVNSPPCVRPKQRLQTNKAGNAVAASDEQVPELIVDNDCWFGTGKVHRTK